MSVQLDLGNYRGFIVELRKALGVGYPPTGAAGPVEVVTISGRGFRYRTTDFYLTHVRLGQGKPWQEVVRPNYAQMGLSDTTPVTSMVIRNSCEYGDVLGGSSCAMAILATAEAARSQVVYQVLQQVLQGRAAAWGMTSPLLGIWGKYTTYHHKRRPVQYGALGVRDYYDDPEANRAISALRASGFQIDG